MRTLEQIYYEEPEISLGSSQYDEIAKNFIMLNNGTVAPLKRYQNFIDDPVELKETTERVLNKYYDKFSLFMKTPYKDIDKLSEDFREEYLWDIEPTHRDFLELKKRLSKEPFKFPVKGHLTKIAFLELVSFHKNQAWDLWTFLGELRSLTIDKCEYKLHPDDDVRASIEYANIMFIFKKLYDLDNTIIQKYFGGFDT